MLLTGIESVIYTTIYPYPSYYYRSLMTKLMVSIVQKTNIKTSTSKKRLLTGVEPVIYTTVYPYPSYYYRSLMTKLVVSHRPKN